MPWNLRQPNVNGIEPVACAFFIGVDKDTPCKRCGFLWGPHYQTAGMTNSDQLEGPKKQRRRPV